MDGSWMAHGCPGSRETAAVVAETATTKQLKTLAAGWPGSAFERTWMSGRNASRAPVFNVNAHPLPHWVTNDALCSKSSRRRHTWVPPTLQPLAPHRPNAIGAGPMHPCRLVRCPDQINLDRKDARLSVRTGRINYATTCCLGWPQGPSILHVHA
ncbi:hypothetical protein BGZ61DRAFT_129646 [Ilyonectria robusta]|uniref:uncharacterized protein n=1 Tax=Ilyonectria robusta TaxID=1079257 RepID=UPI001E8CDDD7|nr:uncharacterized protein BGZ61DRAFT_129646 [Ilyonectria robusta]KAH8734778.1 hypothetical protein BGZ61DRAFT_129646 [Ilyonectria robusta]